MNERTSRALKSARGSSPKTKPPSLGILESSRLFAAPFHHYVGLEEKTPRGSKPNYNLDFSPLSPHVFDFFI